RPLPAELAAPVLGVHPDHVLQMPVRSTGPGREAVATSHPEILFLRSGLLAGLGVGEERAVLAPHMLRMNKHGIRILEILETTRSPTQAPPPFFRLSRRRASRSRSRRPRHGSQY